jgi:hypothetical protein
MVIRDGVSASTMKSLALNELLARLLVELERRVTALAHIPPPVAKSGNLGHDLFSPALFIFSAPKNRVSGRLQSTWGPSQTSFNQFGVKTLQFGCIISTVGFNLVAAS